MIVKANYDDLKQILTLQKEAYQSEAKLYNDYSISPLTQSLEEIRNDYLNQTILKATHDNTIIGSVRAYQKGNVCHIGRLIVHPKHQNKGNGKELMNTIEKLFGACDKYSLFTGYRSEKNLHLYTSLGYKRVKREKMNSSVTLIYLEKSNYDRSLKNRE
ncbi:GNAT family N-acetyltransferase [Chitinispirillales bacterium ANBcel5]|uniref:GNAT family N-acetyltransferase n=1 Tax=Cellulosispirillum alkaliphilum TaxID=3039283 RepID=UPI002A5428C1|nr:GNAT family N-acetyltransferase [Chitinispirillales bacterium ANBcel5]